MKRSETTVSQRGRTAIPAEIRRKYGIEAGDRLCWIDDGESIQIVPLPSDPIGALRGDGRNEGLLEALLASRNPYRGRDC